MQLKKSKKLQYLWTYNLNKSSISKIRYLQYVVNGGKMNERILNRYFLNLHYPTISFESIENIFPNSSENNFFIAEKIQRKPLIFINPGIVAFYFFWLADFSFSKWNLGVRKVRPIGPQQYNFYTSTHILIQYCQQTNLQQKMKGHNTEYYQ